MMKAKEIKALEKVLHAELLDVLEILFAIADEEMDTAELAERSSLCGATIDRLKRGEFVWPRAQTIQKLAYAVGLHVAITPEGATLALATSKKQKRRTSKRRSKKREVATA